MDDGKPNKRNPWVWTLAGALFTSWIVGFSATKENGRSLEALDCVLYEASTLEGAKACANKAD